MTAPIDKAIELMGGPVAAARTLGLSGYQVVQQWRRTRVPAEYCGAIEQATAGQVKAEDLRPDVFAQVVAARVAQQAA